MVTKINAVQNFEMAQKINELEIRAINWHVVNARLVVS